MTTASGNKTAPLRRTLGGCKFAVSAASLSLPQRCVHYHRWKERLAKLGGTGLVDALYRVASGRVGSPISVPWNDNGAERGRLTVRVGPGCLRSQAREEKTFTDGTKR